MALDKEYFDAIHIEVAKKKYYNANKVEAVFADIRRQAEALNAENERMRTELAALDNHKAELGDAVFSAQRVYQDIVDKANARAEEILSEARRQSEAMLEEAQRQQDYSVRRVEASFARIREQHLAAIEALNAEWQDFLCGLYPEEEQAAPPTDLEQKVGAIASELFSIQHEDDGVTV